MSKNEILNFITANPLAIASEIGVTPIVMKALEEEGVVARSGVRSTGKRGRPPVQWVIAGSVVAPNTPKPSSIEDMNAVNAPALPVMSDEIRAALDPEAARKIAFIEKVFAGKDGLREIGDFRILSDEYSNIMRRTSKTLTRSLPVFEAEAA